MYEFLVILPPTFYYLWSWMEAAPIQRYDIVSNFHKADSEKGNNKKENSDNTMYHVAIIMR